MSRERRNLYRQLYVQPEAPPEVIKAAWRALMSTLRGHPDLGGDPERAARLNVAYEVLSDPERRRAYDLSLRRPSRQGASSAPADAPGPSASAAPSPEPAWTGDWLSSARCPFCHRAFSGRPGRDSRCSGCGSPLCPAPTREAGSELLGRRGAERFERQTEAEVRRPGEAVGQTARLRDLSFSGLSLLQTEAVPKGVVLRVSTGQFDALVRVVACRAAPGGHSVHAQLLTLLVQSAARGVYVNTQA